MPRYFLTVRDSQDLPDKMGTVLSDFREARSEAAVGAGGMLKNIDSKFWIGADWTMAGTDEQGVTVCTLRFRDTTGIH